MLFVPLVITAEFVHVAVVPEVVQTQPLLLVGKVPKVVLVGICTTSVTVPTLGPVPILVTVTGIKLGWPATGLGLGWPTVVVKSGLQGIKLTITGLVAPKQLVVALEKTP